MEIPDMKIGVCLNCKSITGPHEETHSVNKTNGDPRYENWGLFDVYT
jgi:hypothetical protein